MSSNTTAQAQPAAASPGTAVPAPTVDQARAAWATASRDTELDRWHELYALAVPLTAMTTWERHEAGFPPRDADERARYAGRDQCSGQPGAGIEAGQ